jgi:hypothetical protein
MGKRKSSSKPMGPKKKDPLPTTFACLFCNHENSVSVKLDKKAGVGHLDCRVCGQKFQCAVNCTAPATTTVFNTGRIVLLTLRQIYPLRLTFMANGLTRPMLSPRKTTRSPATVAHLEEDLDEATEQRSKRTTTTNTEMMIIKRFFYAPCNNTKICYVLYSKSPFLPLATRYDI